MGTLCNRMGRMENYESLRWGKLMSLVDDDDDNDDNDIDDDDNDGDDGDNEGSGDDDDDNDIVPATI